MSKFSLHHALTLSLGLTLVSGLAAFAQEAAPATDAPATEAPADAAAQSADDLNMGTTAQAAPVPVTQETAEVNQGYTLATFDSWQQNCVKTADGADPCQMYQLLKDKDGNSVAVQVRYRMECIETDDGWKCRHYTITPMMPLPGSLTEIHGDN